ncbi:hypothetical protein SprV_0702340700 [Sparganum proliferum]
MAFRMFENNASEDLPSDDQQGNVSVVFADLTVLFPLVDVRDCGVLEILRDFSLTKYLLEEPSQMIHELWGTSACRSQQGSGRFVAVELLHGPDGFVERGREIKVGIGLHLRQTDNGDVDGGGTVEDASGVCGLSL